jgi:Flp pilus assembly protein TadD
MHFLLGKALEKKGGKAGATEAFRQACPMAPQGPKYIANYKELVRQE